MKEEVKTMIENNILMAEKAIEEEKNLLSLETSFENMMKRRIAIEKWRGYSEALKRILEELGKEGKNENR
ncbi:hypothetical protein DRN75_03830 [Nanoarchaeota archaeon]|nr:MAG: hypothetical protein DRN75_03830 [Nanoarchaeota archaeon]